MASVEVGECWLALGWYWSLVSQWFGSNGEAFVPSSVDPFVTEKEPFWVGWREWRGEWYQIEKLKCVLKKKIIIFIIYEIVCREKILVRRICWILFLSRWFVGSFYRVDVSLWWVLSWVGMKTCFTAQVQTDPMRSGIWNLMTLDGNEMRVISECYRIASWDVVWKK